MNCNFRSLKLKKPIRKRGKVKEVLAKLGYHPRSTQNELVCHSHGAGVRSKDGNGTIQTTSRRTKSELDGPNYGPVIFF